MLVGQLKESEVNYLSRLAKQRESIKSTETILISKNIDYQIIYDIQDKL